MKTIFIHGGPGLNSWPEENILKPVFDFNNIDILFWNEPKDYSSVGGYDELCHSLVSFIKNTNEKVNIIAHSAGCMHVIAVIKEVEHLINKICFLSPAIDLNYTSDRIIEVALDIFSKTDSAKESTLRSLKSSLVKGFDSTKEEAILLAMSSNYFVKNFVELDSFENYFGYLVDDKAFNLDNYLKVSRSIPVTPIDYLSSVPVLCFLGALDPVFEVAQSEGQVKKYFSDVKVVVMDDTSHYPHIENTESVMSSYLEFLSE